MKYNMEIVKEILHNFHDMLENFPSLRNRSNFAIKNVIRAKENSQ